MLWLELPPWTFLAWILNTMSAYEDWVNTCCAEFRQQCEGLRITPTAVGSNNKWLTLFPPSQMYIVGCRDPSFQFVLITHNDTRPDLDRLVDVNVPAYEFTDVLETFKERQEFQIPRLGTRLFPSVGGQETVGAFLDRWFASFLAGRWTRVAKARPGMMRHLSVGTDASLYEWRGRIIDQSAVTFAQKMIERLRAVLAPPVSQEPSLAQALQADFRSRTSGTRASRDWRNGCRPLRPRDF
jgi:hypothetical protein